MTTENSNTETTNNNQPEIPSRSKISNGTLINVVLFIGLVILYIFIFLPSSDQETIDDKEIALISERVADGSLNIAFVNSDSLMANYQLALEMREEFESEQQRLEADLQRRQRNFQTEVETFQRQIQSGAISMENAQVKEQELMQKQQEIIQLNDTYSNRLMTKEVEMNTDLYQKITELLGRHSTALGYDYIMGFSPGGGILYANTRHDITFEVLEKLNNEYEASK